ncbi:MAG: MCE family protein [Bacteroidales bacterium]|jgi:phospholipid/cholesterol/gamma-HCH transport system substrate-binding protein|nr:MlaD family protein [Bacteroidales bacterium]MCK9499607.1 MlaD family protein [Bacteroidales bacterium]NLB85699.1 MCE family protein [Bacteroidales bacterium]
MKKKWKYILYSFIAIVILAVAYWGFNFLKGISLFNSVNSYYVYYDRIEGLNESSHVTVNGYKVGQVGEIKLLPQDNYKLLVRIDIDKNLAIPDSSIARIYSMDLMGTKGIELKFGNQTSYIKPNDFLIGEVEQSLKDEVSMQMLPVKQQAENLMEELTHAIAIITYIFNENTRANLEKSFESIKNTLTYIESSAISMDGLLKEESSKIAKTIYNLEFITTTLKNNSANLENIFKNLSSFSDTLVAIDLSKTIAQANAAVENFNQILDKANRGEGSLGKLLNDDNFAKQIEDAANNLKSLLFDIQYNPKKYVNFSLMNIGRTVNVADPSELSKRDKKVLEKQIKKNEKEAQKNYEKEQKRENKSDDLSKYQGKLVFMIQIRSAVDKIDLSSSELKGYTDVVEIKSGSYYKYLIFPHESPSQTDYYTNLAKEDFSDAFPVALIGDNVISYAKGLTVMAGE